MAGPLRELLARFGIDVDDRGMQKADATLNGFVTKLQRFGKMIAGGLVARAITTFVGAQIELGDQIATTAAKLGIGTTALQELQYAAELSDVPVSVLERSMARFSRNAAEAAVGTGTAKDTFRQLGIELRDAAGNMRPAETMLFDVAEAIKNTSDQSERIRIAFDLFGRAGVDMITMLQQGGVAIEDLRRAAQASGGILPPELIAQAEAGDEAIKKFNASLQGVKTSLMLGVLPVINRLIEGTSNAMRRFTTLTRGTYVLEAGFAAAAVAAALLGRNAIRAAVAQLIAWAPIIATVALVALGIMAVAIIADEVIKTFQGGDTVIRRFIDGLFGVGATESAVNGVKLIVEALTNAFSLLWERASENLALIRVEFGVLHARGIQLWKAIKSGAEELFAALPAPAQAAVESILSFFQDTLLGGVIGVFDRIKSGARELVSIFGEGIYNLAFGRDLQAREAAGGGLAPAGAAAFRNNAKVFTPPAATSTTNTTNNNRRVDLNVNVRAQGAGAGDIAGAIKDQLTTALATHADEA